LQAGRLDRDNRPTVPLQEEGYKAGNVPFHGEQNGMMQKVRGDAVLTAVDETIIVLVVGFASIAFPLEGNCSGAL
jgi:hypothetical protein